MGKMRRLFWLGKMEKSIFWIPIILIPVKIMPVTGIYKVVANFIECVESVNQSPVLQIK